jgi:CheY-like chemotaxis protein
MARVIVIDDENLVAEACALVLRTAGHTVAVANDGCEGLRLVRNLSPDLIVSDIRMEGMDGFQLVAAVRAEPATAHIPVLLMSGHGHADAGNCDAFLAKPFSVPEFLKTIRALLARAVKSETSDTALAPTLPER